MPLPLRLLLTLLVIGILLFAALLLNVVIREKQVYTKVEQVKDYDAIIVLGAQVKPDGTPSVQLTWRLEAAAEAWKRQAVPVVVCGAQGSDEPMPEAVAMKEFLMRSGVEESSILTDPDSFNTRENIANAAKLLSDRSGIEKVLIVSSDYHVPRAVALAQDQKMKAEGLGAPCLPEYWIKNHAREALAWVKYWLQKYLHISL